MKKTYLVFLLLICTILILSAYIAYFQKDKLNSYASKINDASIKKDEALILRSDSLFHLKKGVYLFAKYYKKDEIKLIKNQNWGDSEQVETAYNLLVLNNKPIELKEIPTSESGDSYYTNCYYFDSSLNTVAIIIEFAFSAEECYQSGIAKGRIKYLYDHKFNLIYKDSSISHGKCLEADTMLCFKNYASPNYRTAMYKNFGQTPISKINW